MPSDSALDDALFNNASIVGRSGNFFQDLRDVSELERSIAEGSAPLGDEFNMQNVLRRTFDLAQPQNVAGEMMRVTDVGTIDEIEASRSKRIMKDVGNGLAIMAYKDQATGQYFKQYVRSNPDYINAPASGTTVSSTPNAPLGFAKSFYG
jgi:hypothetical protein